MLVGKTQADYIPVSIDSDAKNNSRHWKRVGECEALRKSSAQQSRRWLNKQTNKQPPTPRRTWLKRHEQGAAAAFCGKQILRWAGRPGKPANGSLKLLGENESVLAVSQHMLDLSEKTGISVFINDDGREVGWRGRRFDFRTICDPACRAMVRLVAAGQPWPRTASLLTGKGREGETGSSALLLCRGSHLTLERWHLDLGTCWKLSREWKTPFAWGAARPGSVWPPLTGRMGRITSRNTR